MWNPSQSAARTGSQSLWNTQPVPGACRTLTLVAALCLTVGCSKPCVEFAEKVCERTSADLSECAPDENGTLDKRCEKVRSVVASCRDLKKQAEAASDADNAQCEANLELLSALERQQQQR